MIRFDFLHDAPPAAWAELLRARIPDRLRTALAATCTIAVVLIAWWAVEKVAIRQAQHEFTRLKAMADASRADLARAHVRRSHVEALLALDARVRRIRLSGAELSGRLSDIANHLPERAWTTSIRDDAGELEIDGATLEFDDLGPALADLLTSRVAAAASLVRAGRDGAQSALAFSLRSRQATP
jgi:Tfp pilus assembly protein PilN